MTGDFQPQKAQLIMTLRGMGILDSRVLAALESVPRELFVPPALRHEIYCLEYHIYIVFYQMK